MRRIARAFRPGALSVAIERNSVELHAVIDEAEAELLGDPLLEHLELIVDELDDVAGLDVDQMVVVGFGGSLVTRAAIAELVPLQDSRLLEQADSTIDGRDRDVRIDGSGTRMQRLDVRMVVAVTEHARDGLALLGDPEPLV